MSAATKSLNHENVTKAIRAAVAALLPLFDESERDEILDKSIDAGDPYGWSAGALCTINTENGLGGWLCLDEPRAIERMIAIGDAASEHLGAAVYLEPVNAAVIAVHQG